MCPSMMAGVAISTRALCGSCSRASAGIRSTTRGQYCAFWNIIGACDDAIPIPSMVSLLNLEVRLGRRGPSPATACSAYRNLEVRLGRRGPSPATACSAYRNLEVRLGRRGPSSATTCSAYRRQPPRSDAERSLREFTAAGQAGQLHRQLIAVRRRGDLERVDDARQQGEVVRRRGELDQPLRAVAFLERVEGRLVDAVGAQELPDVG